MTGRSNPWKHAPCSVMSSARGSGSDSSPSGAGQPPSQVLDECDRAGQRAPLSRRALDNENWPVTAGQVGFHRPPRIKRVVAYPGSNGSGMHPHKHPSSTRADPTSFQAARSSLPNVVRQRALVKSACRINHPNETPSQQYGSQILRSSGHAPMTFTVTAIDRQTKPVTDY